MICIGCGDTGKNSKGGICYPCLVNGRVKEEVLPSVKRRESRHTTEPIILTPPPIKKVVL